MRTGSNKMMRMGSNEVSAERGGDEFNYGWTVNDGDRGDEFNYGWTVNDGDRRLGLFKTSFSAFSLMSAGCFFNWVLVWIVAEVAAVCSSRNLEVKFVILRPFIVR
jgi:hypothetical protein